MSRRPKDRSHWGDMALDVMRQKEAVMTAPTCRELLDRVAKGELSAGSSSPDLILAARVEKVLALCREAERAKISQGIVSAGLILRLLNGGEP